MIIKVNKTIQSEIELTFPCSFKHRSSPAYYHFNTEKTGINVMGASGSINTASPNNILFWDELEPCEKSEVEEAFNKVVSQLKDKL